MSETSLLRHLSDANAINILAFVGGFVDAAGYLKLRALFTSSITGNVVIACTAVSGNLTGVISRAFVTISFVVAGFFTTLLALKLRLSKKLDPRMLSMALFSIEIATLTLSLILGIYYNDDIDNANDVDNLYIIIVGSSLAFAMGAHSVAAKESFANCPPTTVMTNTLINVSGAGAAVVGYFLTKNYPGVLSLNPVNAAEDDAMKASVAKNLKDWTTKFLILGQPLFFFILGAIIGALIMYYGQFWCLFVPLFAVIFIVVDTGIKYHSISVASVSSQALVP